LAASIGVPRSDEHAHRHLDERLEGREQLCAKRSVDHAMVARQRHAQHAGESDSAVFFLDRLTARGADCEDGRVRRIDDGGKFAHAVHAEIGDGRRPALIIGRRKLLVPRASREIFHLGRDGAERLGIRRAKDRRHQAVIKRDRDADIGVFEAQDTVARPYRVRRRHALQRQGQRANDEIVERQLEQRIAVCILQRPRIGFFA
jgi:hypothetical protein